MTMSATSDPWPDAAAFAHAVARVDPAAQASFGYAAFNQMSRLTLSQDYDRITDMVEVMPEQWIAEPHRATWLLAGAHAAMHSTNPLMRRHRALIDRFSQACVTPFLAAHPRLAARKRVRPRLAIGFLGAILRQRSYTDRGIRDVIAGFDRKRFEVHALAFGAADLPAAAWLGADATHVLGDEVAAAHHLRALGLDIVVYLDGVGPSMPWQLLARRIARLQVTWFHPHLTFGAIGMDGQIADRGLIPLEQRQWYAEPILDVPVRAHCYSVTPRYAANDTPWRRTGRITFASFNRLTKISLACAKAWAAILHRVPTARLIILNEMVHNDAERRTIEQRLTAAGVPLDRVEFDGGHNDAEFLARYGDVDLVLDTFPFAGGITSFDGLCQGTPILTIEGAELVQRQTASLLRSIALEDLITTTEADYIRTAVALANAPETLERLRQGLRERVVQSPICDMHGLARDMGEVLQGLL
jgi:predicted O-linked N-acetylglucosamine transferase (SPINDLY family)